MARLAFNSTSVASASSGVPSKTVAKSATFTRISPHRASPSNQPEAFSSKASSQQAVAVQASAAGDLSSPRHVGRDRLNQSSQKSLPALCCPARTSLATHSTNHGLQPRTTATSEPAGSDSASRPTTRQSQSQQPQPQSLTYDPTPSPSRPQQIAATHQQNQPSFTSNSHQSKATAAHLTHHPQHVTDSQDVPTQAKGDPQHLPTQPHSQQHTQQPQQQTQQQPKQQTQQQPQQQTQQQAQQQNQPTAVMVDCFEVQQCEGLEGHVSISGAKNSALAVLAGAICSQEPLVLRRIPDLHDIRRMFQVLESIGVKVERGIDGLSDSVLVDASQLTSVAPCPDVVRKLRASFFVIGALVGRQGEAVVPLPGGCNIGARPIDLHVRGLEALGARVEIRQGKVHVCAKSTNGRLTGGHFYLDFPSVGATETLMMAAALADGETVLSNVAQEPEVVDLADFLTSCGAHIKGAGTNTLYIQGRESLGTPTDFAIIPDRIETGTFLVAAAATRSTISLSPVIPRHLTAVICKLREIGCRVQQTQVNSLTISPGQGPLLASDVTTLPFPGFPTDLQPQFMSLLTQCRGQSVVKETVFESRMRHVEELQKMGALIKVSGSTAVVSGAEEGGQLYGAPVAATDLRAGAALVIAGMAAGGSTHIEGVGHIDRGYEKLDEKLRGLGAKIVRLPCLPAELRL